MPNEKFDLKPIFPSAAPGGGCIIKPLSVEYGPIDKLVIYKPGGVENGADGEPQIPEPPMILIAPHPGWRQLCLLETAKIPSGYTYLAQLVGHDMGNSAKLSQAPFIAKQWHDSNYGEDGDATETKKLNDFPKTKNPVRYNLIENPLTLETVYGPGPTILSHVYILENQHPVRHTDWRFRIPKNAKLTRTYQAASGNGVFFRALYDERNRETLMLHELTAAWMQFHNRNVELLAGRGFSAEQAYAIARTHAVKTWHRIIREDLLPKFLHPGIQEIDTLSKCVLDPVSLLHGLFRAFHCMPLNAYPLSRGGPAGEGSQRQNLKDLMKEGFSQSRAEKHWEIDWRWFFEMENGPKSGISASVDEGLKIGIKQMHLAMADANTGYDVNPLGLNHETLKDARASLPILWPNKCDPGNLANAMTKKYDKKIPGMSAETLGNGNLALALMVEAQLYGENGGFGPLGSALLKASIEDAINKVEYDPAIENEHAKVKTDLTNPETMLELIQSNQGE